MNVAGMHTYVGGFALGVKRIPGVNFLGTVETWKDPIKVSTALGVPHRSSWRDFTERVDLLIANPPCSRFSMMAKEKYSDEDKAHLENFPELVEVVSMGLLTKASTIWWETGPLAYSKGRGIIEEVHNKLTEYWGHCTTVVIRMDLLHVGVPQRRLRTHVFHTNRNIADVGSPQTKTHVIEVGDWIDEMMPEDHGQPVLGSGIKLWKHPIATEDPVRFTTEIYRGAFFAKAPRVVDEQDTHVTSILLDKNFCWAQKNQWWSVNEYYAAMGYDGRVDYSALDPSTVRLRTFCSKSVSPAIVAWLMDKLVVPMYDGFQPPASYYEDQPRGIIMPGVINYFDHKVDKNLLHLKYKHENRK